MPDGFKRKRRNRGDKRAKWYAAFRAARFARRFGGVEFDLVTLATTFKGE
jgi:hypothetical protein